VGMVRGPRGVTIEPPEPSRAERNPPSDDDNVSYSV